MVTPEGEGTTEKQWNKEPAEKHNCSEERSAADLTLFESVGDVTVSRMGSGVRVVAHRHWQVKAVMEMPPTKFPRALPGRVVTGGTIQPKEASEGKSEDGASLSGIERLNGAGAQLSGRQKLAQ